MAVLKYYNTTTSAWEYIAASTTANFTSWKKTAAGGETSVSGTDDNAVTLSYTVGLEQVFINGVLQVRGSDYTATTGTSITGLTALVANDIVTVVCYAPFNIANTIAPTVVDAKGDLLAGTAADTVGRLAVGANDTVLTAASGETTGLKWAGQGLTQVAPASVTVGSGSGSANTNGTVTFSGASSVSLNSVFTSTYDSYRIYVNLRSPSAGSNIFIRMRTAGGSDVTASNYTTLIMGRSAAGATVELTSTNDTASYLGQMSTSFTDHIYGITIDMAWPNLAYFTTMNISSMCSDTSTTLRAYTGSLLHGVATAYPSFTIYPSSGNFTGTIQVFGYRQ
jgi:hypothetical protein